MDEDDYDLDFDDDDDDENWKPEDDDDCDFDIDIRRCPVRAWMMEKWWAAASAPLMDGPARFNRGVGCRGMGLFGGCYRLPPDEVDVT